MKSTNLINREYLNQHLGTTLIEFGASWCSYCQAAKPMINATLALYPHVQHIKIEDGKGERLGRTYAVKLWPTLILLQDGVEIDRVIRPLNNGCISAILSKLK